MTDKFYLKVLTQRCRTPRCTKTAMYEVVNTKGASYRVCCHKHALKFRDELEKS